MPPYCCWRARWVRLRLYLRGVREGAPSVVRLAARAACGSAAVSNAMTAGACQSLWHACDVARPQAALSGHGALLRCAPPDARRWLAGRCQLLSLPGYSTMDSH